MGLRLGRPFLQEDSFYNLCNPRLCSLYLMHARHTLKKSETERRRRFPSRFSSQLRHQTKISITPTPTSPSLAVKQRLCLAVTGNHLISAKSEQMMGLPPYVRKKRREVGGNIWEWEMFCLFYALTLSTFWPAVAPVTWAQGPRQVKKKKLRWLWPILQQNTSLEIHLSCKI